MRQLEVALYLAVAAGAATFIALPNKYDSLFEMYWTRAMIIFLYAYMFYVGLSELKLFFGNGRRKDDEDRDQIDRRRDQKDREDRRTA
jgi:hypothetical protein